MADNGKSNEKAKSSLFGGKISAKKESKKKMTKTQRKRLGSKSSSAENVSENVNGVEGNAQSLELDVTETSKANSATSSQNESSSKTDEICNNRAVGEAPGDNLEANTEHSLTNEPIVSEETNNTRNADCEQNENIIASAVSDEQENCVILDDTAIEKHVEVSREQTEDDKREKQIESDVENKGYEIMATGDLSKKHGKAASGPLASFRRHRKKSKLSKLSQDAERNTSEKKEESVSESLDIGKDSAKAKAKEVVDLNKDKTEIEVLDSAGKMVEIKEASETQQKYSSTAKEMVNETSEEKRINKRHKEKRSGPFASFRKSKKKDSEKQKSESSKNEENKPDDANETPENAKENVTDVPEANEENVVQLDKEMTEIKQINTAGEKCSPENDSLDSPATVEEQIVLNEEPCTQEKNTEKPKKGKRFGSFSSFSRTKKAPKMSEQTAPPSSPQIDSPEKNVTQEQGQIETDQSTTTKVLQDESSTDNKVAELVPTEISKDKPIGSETEVPEISTETGNEEQLQEDLGPNQEKKKRGLKKRISKIRLHSSKSKESKTKDNQVKDSTENQTELELKEKNPEAGTDDNEVSLQVKRKKTGAGGLQKKISKALKRNKSGQLELNEPYDDPSASEEEIQPSLENKSPISTSPTEPREGTTTYAKQDEPVKQAPEIVPEVIEVLLENEQNQSDEKFPSTTSDADVKRVTFSLDEEKHSEKPEDSHEQPENTSSELEQETTENIAEHEDVEPDISPDKDSVTIEEKESVPTDNEVKPEEDLQTPKAASDLQPDIVVSDIPEVDNRNLNESSVAPSLESLESTGTIVLLQSSESELTRVSPIPGMFEPINEGAVESTQEKPIEERVEKENVVNEELLEAQQHDGNTEFENTKDDLKSSEPVANKVNSPENVEELALSSEKEHENNATSLTCSEAEEVEHTSETDTEKNIEKTLEKSLENSLETSIQNFLSQSTKEEWILVKPRLEISQEMSHQVKALALESYAHRPACCKLM